MSANIIDHNSVNPERGGIVPNYSLDQSELLTLEKSIVKYAMDMQPKEGVHALLIDPTHPFSNYIRTQEENAFPGASKVLSIQAELETRQLALVDTRARSRSYGRIAFVSTISGFREEADVSNETTGIATLDELIGIAENNFSVQDFNDYCLRKGVNPRRAIGVETSIKLINGMQKYHALRTTQLAYLAIFNIAMDLDIGDSRSSLGAAVVSRENQTTATSIKRASLIHGEPLAGKTDWITPDAYNPVIYNSHRNRLLNILKPLSPKIITVENQ